MNSKINKNPSNIIKNHYYKILKTYNKNYNMIYDKNELLNEDEIYFSNYKISKIININLKIIKRRVMFNKIVI